MEDKSKYRIKECTNQHGSRIYFPQYKFFDLFWINLDTADSYGYPDIQWAKEALLDYIEIQKRKSIPPKFHYLDDDKSITN